MKQLKSHVSALKWRNVGNNRPDHGEELTNNKLSEALQQKVEFKWAEWKAFNVDRELQMNHFIQSGGSYFQPTAKLSLDLFGSFELRFRLQVVGYSAASILDDPTGERLAKVKELKEIWERLMGPCEYRADAKVAKRLNGEVERLGLPHLGFTVLPPHHHWVFEVEMQLDGTPRYLMPTPDGNSEVHREINRRRAAPQTERGNHRGQKEPGGNLLRVRIVELSNKERTDANAKRELDGLLSHIMTAGLTVLARHFMHFCHKDADQPKTRQLWFAAISPHSLRSEGDNGLKSIRVMQEMLLDVTATKKVSKAMARLALGFSPALPLCVHDSTSATFGRPWEISDLREEGLLEPGDDVRDAKKLIHAEKGSLPSGTIRLSIIHDIIGVDTQTGRQGVNADGEANLMTDGCGLISLNLARAIPEVKGGRDASNGDARGAPLICQVRLCTAVGSSNAFYFRRDLAGRSYRIAWLSGKVQAGRGVHSQQEQASKGSFRFRGPEDVLP